MARKTGIFAGILALIVAFIQKIPIYPEENISLIFYIFMDENIEHYIWGYLINGNKAFTLIRGGFPENLVAIMMWVFAFFIGLSSIMASTTKATYKYSAKLYRLNLLLLLFLVGIYTTVLITIHLGNLEEILISVLSSLGPGYYSLVLCIILNALAIRSLNKTFLE
ncbi:MAG: hypothetical protein ACOC44_17220 [Promethearchaeia archaeon]